MNYSYNLSVTVSIFMILANRLIIPNNTQAILWDMDGVLIDSLTLDYNICERLLSAVIGKEVVIEHSLIKALFPFDLHEMWRRILAKVVIDLTAPEKFIAQLVTLHDAERQNAQFPINAGIKQILDAARLAALKLAVVSNNPTKKIIEILNNVGLDDFFDQIVGNDIVNIAKKPAPDSYQLAIKLLNVEANYCVVIEDSLIGAQAGHDAGCYTIGVATGADTFEALTTTNLVNCAYQLFAENLVKLTPGAVTEKTILTPNDFVSHMIEHLAWRLGCSVKVTWYNSNWLALGQAFSANLINFPRRTASAAVIGMIDDGSAEIKITAAAHGQLFITSTAQVDCAWFLASRCEQLVSGTSLLELLEGIALTLSLIIEIKVCNFEDPHHTWEGIFRSVGIALNRLLIIPSPDANFITTEQAIDSEERHWQCSHESPLMVELSRITAESEVKVLLNFNHYAVPNCDFAVANSIKVDGIVDLLNEFAINANCQLNLTFKATRLSSSHVVMEDIGMVMGRALKIMLVHRMWRWGINGAGSNVINPNELDQSPIGVALSVEGRKFWTFVPFYTTFSEFRRQFLIGHTIGRGLFSEDLDDFIDGFAGGISGSVIIHVRREISPQEGWRLIFSGLGTALAETMAINPARRGVPPGVKATLA